VNRGSNCRRGANPVRRMVKSRPDGKELLITPMSPAFRQGGKAEWNSNGSHEVCLSVIDGGRRANAPPGHFVFGLG
jgi:hypothetical protein